MLFDILQTITDFVVLLTRLTTEDLADEQRMALIGQFIHIQRLDAAFRFDLHDLLIILITVLIIIFWRARDRTDRWPYRRFKLTRMISHNESAMFFSRQAPTANGCAPNMLQVLNAARKVELRVFYAPHHRYRPGGCETWKYVRDVSSR